MTQYVLVAGAWLGAWAWDEVGADLRGAGHGAHALTLAGVGDRREEVGEAVIDQETHVQDIVGAVERLDLRDVVLVGHSYSGIPVGQAAQRVGDRLARVVFVDSNVPVDGESFVSGSPAVEASIAGNGGFWAPLTPEEFEGQGLTDDQIARIVAGSTPHPGGSLTGRARLDGSLGDLPATYIKCLLDWPELPPEVAELVKSDNWRLVEMNTGHWPMFSQPHELARILLSA
ncbi:alpha/beta fold hydrolase [Streptomyces sp. NBC_01716]|uniref:alpha/beta fold hydrolase n=1 Tax=Streptomyces sp. NBC_01716 TaxID=2975917 RepID=UPI002E2FAEDF|nr:alpha/beta fold hydrolase [Streptomyces sp. NBC_01716]